MEINYRKAEIKDIPELVRLRLDFLGMARGKTLPPEQLAVLKSTNTEYFTSAMLDGSLVIFIAEEGDKIAATSGIMFYRLMPNPSYPDGRRAYIGNMYTLHGYRRKGIATRLLELQLEEAKMRGVSAVQLSATDEGRPVYEKIGFINVDYEMVYKF